MKPFGDGAITSWGYIRDNFEPSDRLAVVIKGDAARGLIQRIVTADQLAGPQFQAWLRHENARGNNIYISMNPLKEEARGRTKQDIATIRHIYLDLDRDGYSSLSSILTNNELPPPTYVLNTSPGKYQVIWKADGFGISEAEELQRAMARKHDADRAATDVTRVLRLPGLYNHKYDPPCLVTAVKVTNSIRFPGDFRIDLDMARTLPPEMARPALKTGVRAVSESERDWAETLRRLSRGENASDIRAWLEQKRSDKSNPAFYAELTIRKAAAELERRQAAGPGLEIC